jgi:hypothetical protein
MFNNSEFFLQKLPVTYGQGCGVGTQNLRLRLFSFLISYSDSLIKAQYALIMVNLLNDKLYHKTFHHHHVNNQVTF